MNSDNVDLLREKGPLLGKEFAVLSGLDIYPAWKYCRGAKEIISVLVGNRYLRLDARVKGYARLSPSIMREFLNYTVVGLSEQKKEIDDKAKKLNKEINSISAAKIDLARRTVKKMIVSHPESALILEKTCMTIAGDVVFNMAHAEPRPESSTGELVKGSDLDIIVITDGLPFHISNDLDQIFYHEKYNLLMNPALKEELDYVIKNVSVISEQLHFNNFKNMVASKILDEGQFLYGNPELFNQVKSMVAKASISSKLLSLTRKAEADRLLAEQTLSDAGRLAAADEELMTLFYTTEEKEEIF